VAFGVYHLNLERRRERRHRGPHRRRRRRPRDGRHSWQRLGPTIAAHALNNILAVPLVV